MEVTKCVNCGKDEVTHDHFEEDGGDDGNGRDLTGEFVKSLKDFGGDDEEDGGLFKEGIGGDLGKTCAECGDLIKKAVELRDGQRRLEEEVLRLQSELLGKLRCLEGDLGEYLVMMRKIEEKGVGGYRKRSRGNDLGVGFRRRVKRAVQDLSQWHGQLKRKTGGSNVTSEEPKLVLKTETFEEDEPVPSPVSPEANSVEEDDPLDSGGEPLEVDNPEPEQSSDSSSSDDSLPDLLSPFNLTIIRLCLRRKKMYLRKYRKHAKLPSPSSDNLPLDIRYQFNYSPSSSELSLNSHPIQIHHSPSTFLSCSLCPYQTTHNLPPTKSIDQIFNHYCHVHFSAFHCPHCPRIFKTRKKYQEHLATHRKPRKPIQCQICLKPVGE